jgi:hypothetical protein
MLGQMYICEDTMRQRHTESIRRSSLRHIMSLSSCDFRLMAESAVDFMLDPHFRGL